VAAVVAVVIAVVVVVVLRLQNVHHYSRHVRDQGWRSGVYAGHIPADDEAFAEWRGAAIQTATDFMGSATWTQLAHPLLVSVAWRYDPAVQLVLSVPMWPNSGGSLSSVASGEDNTYFSQLGKTLVAAGRANTVIRLGWEFNTPYFRWQVTTPAQARDYAEAWRQVVSAFRAVAGQHFTFVWNPDLANSGIDPALAYPGDAYVDDIGLDVYDYGQPGDSPAQRWQGLLNQRYGLVWQAKFAAAHGKPLAYPEWGLVHDTSDPAAGGDDPLFVSQMHAWFASHNTAFENYFDDPSANGAAFNVDGNDFPHASAVYLTLFGTKH
jgi:hypothetical protein